MKFNNLSNRQADILHVVLSYALSNYDDINEALRSDDDTTLNVVFSKTGPRLIRKLAGVEVLDLQRRIDEAILEQSL